MFISTYVFGNYKLTWIVPIREKKQENKTIYAKDEWEDFEPSMTEVETEIDMDNNFYEWMMNMSARSIKRNIMKVKTGNNKIQFKWRNKQVAKYENKAKDLNDRWKLVVKELNKSREKADKLKFSKLFKSEWPKMIMSCNDRFQLKGNHQGLVDGK